MSQPSTPTKEEPQVTLSSEKSPKNVDAAWKFLDQNREAAGASEDVDIDKMRRKIDWHIVPLMFCCYTMQFLDKVILNVSALTHPLLKLYLTIIVTVLRRHGYPPRSQTPRKRLLQRCDLPICRSSLLRDPQQSVPLRRRDDHN